jgi:hypothetical protein
MKKLIAKSGKTYTIHQLPNGFWSKWEENKEGLKARGFSPAKVDDHWYLAVYDGGKATEEEREAFEKQQFEDLKKKVKSVLEYKLGYKSNRFENFLSEISNCNSSEELIYAIKKQLKKDNVAYSANTIIVEAKRNYFLQAMSEYIAYEDL